MTGGLTAAARQPNITFAFKRTAPDREGAEVLADLPKTQSGTFREQVSTIRLQIKVFSASSALSLHMM